MKIVFINPNSSAQMTDSLLIAARATLPEAEVLGWTNRNGPPAIEGPADGAAAVPGLMALLPDAQTAGADVIVIACFDDTGLAPARAAAHCPVIGIGEASYVMARLSGQRFSVVTSLPVSIPVIEGNIRDQGHGHVCVEVRASGLAVLEVEDGGPAVLARLESEIAAASQAGADAVILGCAGMSAHLDALQRAAEPRLIDGVRAASALALALCRVAQVKPWGVS